MIFMKPCAILFFLFLAAPLAAQNPTPILERKISVSFEGESLTSALNQIAQQAGFSFSYNAALISDSEKITLQLTNKSVREVLNEIFKGSLLYKDKGRHLILTRNDLATTKAVTTELFISGYVEDLTTGEKIADVSVWEKSSLASAVTDQYGFYKIKLDSKTPVTALSVSKKNYFDTLVSITTAASQILTIRIQPLPNDTTTRPVVVASADTVVQEKKEAATLLEEEFPYESEANIQNIRDTLYREIQASVLPFVGTNGRLSGNVINDYSINFFGGISMGTRQIELGFFTNIDRGDVSWLQIAGFGNLVGGNVYGIQAAGFFNVNRGETKAVQVAGFANTNLNETRGVQVAGFANTNLSTMHGVQVAGFSNYSKGTSVGAQVAGFSNVHLGRYKGSQVAGFANVNTVSLQGTQIAGFANVATGDVSGSQVASFFNYGKNVRGTQVSLFNYADSLGGVPVGLVSFVNHGYHKLELSADEVFYTNLAFRTGVRQFYNILFASMKPDFLAKAENVWSFGYGIGTARKLTRWLHLNIDATAQHVNKGGITNALSLLNKAHLGLDFQLTRKLSLYAGATVNGYLTRTTFTNYPQLFTDHQPSVFYDHTSARNVNTRMWTGWKVGLRVL